MGLTCRYSLPYCVDTGTTKGDTMKYAVVTVGETYHIGNLDTATTMCDQPQATWRTMLDTRNKTLLGAYSLIMDRKAACTTCQTAGSKWQTVNA